MNDFQKNDIIDVAITTGQRRDTNPQGMPPNCNFRWTSPTLQARAATTREVTTIKRYYVMAMYNICGALPLSASAFRNTTQKLVESERWTCWGTQMRSPNWSISSHHTQNLLRVERRGVIQFANRTYTFGTWCNGSSTLDPAASPVIIRWWWSTEWSCGRETDNTG